MLRWKSGVPAPCRCGAVLPEAVLQEVGRLDQTAIARVREEARPDVRDSDELHDVLQTLVAVPEEIADGEWQDAIASWTPFLAELMEGWRVVRANVPAQAKASHKTLRRVSATV